MIDFLSRFGTALNGWVNTLRATNAKAVVTLALYVGTFLVWATAVLMKINIDLAAFGAWLAFLAALGGFSLAQFNTERKTDYGYLDRAKAAPATIVQASGETKVTGSPVVVGGDGSAAPATDSPTEPKGP